MNKTPAFPLVILISGDGSNLQVLMNGCRDGSIPASIQAVISNRADAYGLERAQAAGIPVRVLNHKDFPDRESYDRKLAELIESFQPGAVILAGFMRILSHSFVQRFSTRMLNIHPSLLPEFTGLNTHQRALDAGASRHGASVHFVTEELDGGPVVIQAWVPVKSGDKEATLAARVLKQEHRIFPAAVRWFAEGILSLNGKQVVCKGKTLKTPICIAPDQELPF